MSLTVMTAHVSGTTSGRRIPIVPQLEPVANAVAAASRNTTTGTSPGFNESPRTETWYGAVCSASVTLESDHARTRMIIAKSMLFKPAYHASTISPISRMRCPLVMIVAEEGRLEEDMFLTTFLFEEAKHTDFFDRFIREVAGHEGPLDMYLGEAYQTIFYQRLPSALNI